ncbi:uncharacterized protein BKCO1_19000115 [Diplodia corticola]|uniref:Uncharacterized protein n=1 Tax=Diplodia corticola TaxID=236234 RepID=A0A1J9R2X3_9PEZI|nr:uncharacterized protein BKCO1_19000115 [Diplodia corticola]OJD34960.1 hypothetical protein BKCO1_19000115 [Diplodia corticola]
MANYNPSYRPGTTNAQPPFMAPPQAYSAPHPVNQTPQQQQQQQQQLSRYYQDGGAAATNNNQSLAPWTAPPAAPHRGDSYRSVRSQRSQRSHRSRRSVDEEHERKHHHREKRPTMGDSLFAFWGVMWDAVRSPSGKR